MINKKEQNDVNNTSISGIKEKLKSIKAGLEEIKSETTSKSTQNVNKKIENTNTNVRTNNEIKTDIGERPKRTNNYRKARSKKPATVQNGENLNNENKLSNIVVSSEIVKTEVVNPNQANKKISNDKQDKMYVIPLGGLEEVGKNIFAMQYKDEIIVVDCGATFPDENLPGIDLVIPDFTFLENNKDKIKAVFITHGHEDHIGALPYLYDKISKDIPIYSGKLTLALIKSKFENAHSKRKLPKMKEIKGRSKIRTGKYFSVEFIRVTHSIADSYAMAIRTPAGLVFHTGDFKIDLTPVDGLGVDFARLAELGEEGVDLMMSDSTNAEVEGFTPSERSVGEAFKQEFMKAKGRIIVAVFASHIHRIQQIIELAVELGRKVAIDGRSLVKVFEIAPPIGCLNIPEDTLVSLKEIEKLDDDKVLIICTGTQGEPMAALSRIAKKMHKFIFIKEGDTVIISATPIPGNEKAASSNINNLLKFDAEVVFKKVAGIHVSGHGSREEQKLMLSLIKPKYFLPVHGEHRMLKAHKKIAIETGVLKENVIISQNGIKLEVSKTGVKQNGKVTAGATLVDGLGVGDIGQSVIKDRQQLSQDGIVIISYSMFHKNGKIISGPDISTRGFIYFKESEDIITEALELLKTKVDIDKEYTAKEVSALKNNIKEIAAKFFYNKTKRNPVILPIITKI